MKKYISFILILMFIMLINTISFAATEQVSAILNKKISIVFNNELKQFSDVNGTVVYPLSYNDTTYLPVRAISALFETAVEWNGEDNSIYIGRGELVTSTVKSVTTFAGGNNENISPFLMKDMKIGYKEKIQTFTDVNGTVVYPVSYNDTTYLPVRAISNMFGATIDWDGDNQRITIKRENKLASITNVTIKVIDGIICAVVTTDNPLYDYKYYSLSDPSRIVLDLENSTFAINKDTLRIDYKELGQVRFGDQGGNVSRLVLDLDKIDTYIVFQSADRRTTYLALSEKLTEEPVKGKDDGVLVASIGDRLYLPDDDSNNEDDKNIGNNVIDDEPTWGGDNKEENKGLTEAEIAGLTRVTSVTYSPSTDKTKISLSGTFSYEKFMLDEPKRLVIDITDAILDVDGPTEITPKNKNIQQIRFSQNDTKKVRIVFELEKDAEYEISKKSKTLEVTIAEPEYRNMKYEAFKNNATLTLQNVKMNVFDATENAKTNKYTLSYSSSKFDSGKSTLDINDNFVKNIEIKTNKIVINGEANMRFEMEQVGSDVVITISSGNKNNNTTTKKESDDDFVILLDAGHGGSDPGACNNGSTDPVNQEKTYNLKIALKLYEMLQNTEGVRVYISRDDDTYIGQQGRLDFATSRDDTDLFVSVHNNSSTNKNYNGTMVLYYDKEYDKDYGITSKEFASLVLDELVTDLETKNLGVVSRNDLWVLYYAEVPSILCEVSFVSNDEELARLKTDKFQETAARAIYNGIMAAKEQMER